MTSDVIKAVFIYQLESYFISIELFFMGTEFGCMLIAIILYSQL